MIPIRVCVIDDHPMIVKVISETITDEHDMTVVGTADHGNQLERLILESRPHVFVLDLGMSGDDEWDPATEVKRARQKFPEVKIVVVSAYDDAGNIRAMSDAGVSGYLLKNEGVENIAKAVREVYRGGGWYSQAVVEVLVSKNDIILNELELSVLRLLARGYSNNEIADELLLAGQSVRNVLSSIY